MKRFLKEFVPLFLDWIVLAFGGIVIIIWLAFAFLAAHHAAHAQTPQADAFRRQQAQQQAQHEALQRQAREDQARALREEQLRQTERFGMPDRMRS